MGSCTAGPSLPEAWLHIDVLACVPPEQVEDRDVESISSADATTNIQAQIELPRNLGAFEGQNTADSSATAGISDHVRWHCFRYTCRWPVKARSDVVHHSMLEPSLEQQARSWKLERWAPLRPLFMQSRVSMLER
jgi:hypothetical protein